MEKEKDFEELWKIIDENFNWEAVSKTMKALDWTWYLGSRYDKNLYGIPDIRTLKWVCYKILKEVYEHDKECVQSGGFEYGYNKDEGLYLSFIVESCLTEGY